MRNDTAARPILCYVTDRHRLAEALRTTPDAAATLDALRRIVTAAADAGVAIVHVRERDLPAAALYELATRLVNDLAGRGTRLVVNDRADVALAAGAHGVHLREDSISAAQLRTLVPADFLLGRSVHDPAAARQLEEGGGLDYLVYGTVKPTRSKPADWPIGGFAGLRRTVQATRLPVLAIGGLGADDAAEVARAGAAGLAAVDLFQSTPERLAEIVQDLRESFAAVFDSAPELT